MNPEDHKYRVLRPSQGVDANWHITDDGDTHVAHCFGFDHAVDEYSEKFARRIAACLNAFVGVKTEDIKESKWLPIETVPIGRQVLFAIEFDGPGDWRIKCGYKCAERNIFIVFGASWTPTRWMPIPEAPKG